MALTPRFAHVAAASINQTVGDWKGNRRRILEVIQAARSRGATLLALPEMCIPGYSLGDRLLMRGTLERSWAMLEELATHTDGMVVVVGLPLRLRGVLHNCAAVLADGRIVGLVPKHNLATGDVEYENRWYAGWPLGRVDTFEAPDGTVIPVGSLVFEAHGVGRFAVEICEDGWIGLRPGSVYALAGAQILLNPSASWFTLGKHRVRRNMVTQISREDRCAYLYTSLLGCDATRLIFDGSVFIAADGDIRTEGRRFVFSEEYELVDEVIDLEHLAHVRMEAGSWREQVQALERGDAGPAPTLVSVPGNFKSDAVAPAQAPYWTAGTQVTSPDQSLDWLVEAGLVPQFAATDLPHLELELALALALREYLEKTGIPGVALALSGGRDSAMCAVLLHRAFRYHYPEKSAEELRAIVRKRFVTAYMSTANSGSATQTAAEALADEIGAEHLLGRIQSAVDTHHELIRDMMGVDLSWDEPTHDIAMQNVQARLRGSLIWMVANLRNFLLMSTSNKSEAAVGYATMDGDTSGGISPIADVPKSLVSLWLAWARDFHGYESLRHVTAAPPTAELRPPDRAQTDEGDLMPFFVLDQLMFHFVQKGQGPLEMFQSLWPQLRESYKGDARAFAADIKNFVRKVCFAQWKRERFAISFRVTAFDLDPKTGFRFPPVQAPFREELDELDAYVRSLGR
ncbi:MAG: NAD(+) synthase [Deltaproteobacteria bacterium]|nr:MAG: NAD(+) synthase [Deltaproteobacteria bacterium]